MADQLSGGMGNLSLDQAPAAAQLAGQHPGGRSYIPPHLRGKIGANAPPPAVNNGPAPGAMNGLNNSAWAG